MMYTSSKFESKKARLDTYKTCSDEQAGVDIVAMTNVSICIRASAETDITSRTIATIQKIKVAYATAKETP